jgi:HK97 family phage portal protein
MAANSRLSLQRTLAGARSLGRMFVGSQRLDRRALELLGWPVSALSGAPPTASPAEAEGIPAFGRGVDLLASSIANTDWHAARWEADAGVWQRLAEQPAVVDDPDPSADAWQFKYACAVDLIEYGNHLSLLGPLDWRTARASWLLPVPIDLASLVEDPARPGWWSWSVAGMMLVPDEVLHISAGNRSGQRLGRGALRQYSEALGGAVAAERYSSKWFAGGGLPPATIAYAVQPSPATLEEFKRKWRLLSATGEPIAVPPGVTVTPMAQEADKAQLVESRTWNSQLVSMMLGIPPHMLGLPGSYNTYQNVESADIAFVRDTVDRWAQPIAAAFGKQLLPAGNRLFFDWASRMRTDMKSQAEWATTMVGGPIMTVDEGRASVGMPPMAVAAQEGTTPEGVPELSPMGVARGMVAT